MADSAGGVFLNTINGTPDIQVNEGIPNEKRVRDIALAVAESTQTVSVQTVLAEVDDVIYNEDDLTDDLNVHYIGCIKASPVVPLPILPENGKGWIFPVDAQIKSYPIKGELVAIVNFGAQTFYYPATNVINSVNNNLRIGMTATQTKGNPIVSKVDAFLQGLTDGFTPVKIPRPVLQFPGDWALNGRNDQSIRLGKTGGSKTDSIIKIRIANEETDSEFAGSPKAEKINEDASSIYMTREEEVELTVVPKAGKDATPKKFKGPQIILDSGTLTFNTKDKNINMYSASESNFISKGNANLLGSKVKIGDIDDSNLESAVCGEQLVKMLREIIVALQRFGGEVSAATGIGNIGLPVPIPGLAGAASGLNAFALEQTEQAIKRKILSTNVKVSRRKRDNL